MGSWANARPLGGLLRGPRGARRGGALRQGVAAHPPLRALALQENQADAQLLDVEEPTPLE